MAPHPTIPPGADFLGGLAILWRDSAACLEEVATVASERRDLPEPVRIEASAVAVRRMAHNLERIADLLEAEACARFRAASGG